LDHWARLDENGSEAVAQRTGRSRLAQELMNANLDRFS
jgi:hypothetical protein